MEKPAYLIFRGTEAKDEVLIGNLPLKIASAIHAGNIIGIDEDKKYIFVRKNDKYVK
jgi:hypothetical protein